MPMNSSPHRLTRTRSLKGLRKIAGHFYGLPEKEFVRLVGTYCLSGGKKARELGGLSTQPELDFCSVLRHVKAKRIDHNRSPKNFISLP
jgi:hypothetical protein